MERKKFGVDLSESNIKIIEIKESGESYEEVISTNFEINQTNNKDYFNDVKKKLLSFFKKNKIKFPQLFFTIPCSEEAFMCFVKMPDIDKKNIKKSLKYELEEQEIVKNLDDYFYGWEIIEDAENNQKLLAVSLIHKKFLKFFQLLKSSAWKIESLELNPISVGRFVKNNSIVIDCKVDKTWIYFYRNGNIFGITSFDFPQKEIEESISDIVGDILPEQIYSIGIYNELINSEITQENIISKKITDILSEKISCIKKEIINFELKNDFQVEACYCIGEVTYLKYFPEFASKELDIPTEILNVVNMEYSNDYTLSAGAVLLYKYNYMKALNFSMGIKNDLDLSPILLTVLFTALILHAGTFYANNKLDESIKKVQEATFNQTTIINQLENNISEYNESIQANQTEADSIRTLLTQKKWLGDILKVLKTTTPSKILIFNVKSNPGKVVIYGYSENYSNIGFFVKALEQYGTIDINSIEKADTEMINPDTHKTFQNVFKLTMQYNNDRLLPG